MNPRHFINWRLALFWMIAAPAWALTPQEAAALLETEYVAYRSYYPPGSTAGSIENAYFADFLVTQAGVIQASGLGLAETGWLIQRLEARGFKFSLADYPLSRPADTTQLFQGIYSNIPGLHANMRKELGERIVRAKESYPVPTAKIEVRPSLSKLTLPDSLAPLESANAEGTVELTLNQKSGKLSRLTAALEILAQSRTGRELLSDFLPKLKSGEVQVGDLTTAPRRASNAQPGYLPAASISPDLVGFDAVGDPKIKYTIFVDPNAELGVLVSHLAHEIGHFTDRDWKDQNAYFYRMQKQAEDALRSGQRQKAERLANTLKRINDEVSAKTEPFAFHKQVNVHAELSSLFPQAKAFFYGMHQRGRMIPHSITSGFLKEAYGIHSADIVACETSTGLLNPK